MERCLKNLRNIIHKEKGTFETETGEIYQLTTMIVGNFLKICDVNFCG